MRWEDERYVRVYTRDTTEWIALSWQARALFHELLRKVDRAGLMPVGKAGTKGLAGLLRMPHDVVETALAELLEDTCLVAVDDGYLVRNFLEAQEARASDKARKASQRERARDQAGRIGTRRDQSPSADPPAGQPVTNRDEESRDTRTRDQVSRTGHDGSQPVTPSLAVPSQTEQEQEEPELADLPVRSVAPVPTLSPKEHALFDALRKSQCLSGLATYDFAKRLAFYVADAEGMAGKSIADAVASVRQADEKVATEESVGEPSDRRRLAGMVMGFVKSPTPPARVQAGPGSDSARPRNAFERQRDPGALEEIERKRNAFQQEAAEAERRGDGPAF